jgi:hypothetical protein
VVADVLEAVTVLGVIETLILDFPAAFGHAEQRSAEAERCSALRRVAKYLPK